MSKKTIRKWKTAGTITLGTDIVISDPGYEPGPLGPRVVEKMLPGEYVCKLQTLEKNGSAAIVSAIRISHKGHLTKKAAEVEWFNSISVDTAQCGFFDREYFNARAFHSSKEWGKWYRTVLDTTLCRVNPFAGGTIDGKCFVSSSGYGDGAYKCRAKKDEEGNIFDLCLVYIPDIAVSHCDD